MQTEALRIERVTLLTDSSKELDNFCLNVFKGEIFGLVGIDYHGRKALIKLIEQNIPIHYGFVYINGKQANSYKKSDMTYNRVSFIAREFRLVDDLSVAENIFVLRHGFKKHFIDRRVLEKQVRMLSDELSITVEPSKTVGELSFYERCLVSLLKASVNNSHLVVISEISNLLSAPDIKKLHEVMNRMAQRGMSFLYITNHHEDALSICSRIALMKNGRTIRVMECPENVEKTLYGLIPHHWLHNGRPGVIKVAGNTPPPTGFPAALEIKKLYSNGLENLNLTVESGQCAVMLGVDAVSVKGLVGAVTGESPPESGGVLIGRKAFYSAGDYSVINENPAESMIFPGLSVIDNLCFELDKKQKNIWRSKRLKQSVARECTEILGDDVFETDISRIPFRRRLDVVYCRIMLKKPKAVIIVQPFAQADMYLRGHIASMIRELKESGTAVLILAVSKSDSLLVADKALIMDGARVSEVIPREHFKSISSFDEMLIVDP